VIKLAGDEILNVRYLALGAIPLFTDGSDVAANALVMSALRSFDNMALVRDASAAASRLKIPEALPVIGQLLLSEDRNFKRFAAQAITNYGPPAATLLAELQRQYELTDDDQLKALFGKAIAAVKVAPCSQPLHRPASLPETATGVKEEAASQKKVKSPPSRPMDNTVEQTTPPWWENSLTKWVAATGAVLLILSAAYSYLRRKEK